MDQSNGVPKIPLQQSTVVVSAIKDGTVVGSNEIVLSHGPGATDGQLIADAIILQNNGQPFTIAATTTLHRQFGSVASGVVTPVQVTVPNPLACVDSQVLFPSRAANGLSFVVRAAGLVTGGERYQIDINQG